MPQLVLVASTRTPLGTSCKPSGAGQCRGTLR